MERGLSILWIDAICGSVQNSMTPPEKNVVRRIGKPTLYERGCHRPIFRHHCLKQSACGRACWPTPDVRMFLFRRIVRPDGNAQKSMPATENRRRPNVAKGA